jgi:RNA polymerase sigma-70 factor (ECF subfamily)
VTSAPPVGPAGRELDADSRSWLRCLDEASAEREQALSRLHELLLRGARRELSRRAPRLRIAGPELDDLAHQAADDALVSVIGKLNSFRGESRFTTWAYKFAIFEVSSKIGRHFWQSTELRLDAAQWELLPDRFGMDPQEAAQAAGLLAELRRIVEEEFTEHQRRVFVAIVVDGVPLDALVDRLDTNRNAIYKTVFDARRKLRAALVTKGYLADEAGGR